MNIPKGQEEIAISLNMEIEESSWIAAYVECENGAMAFCTPVYVVVDGKPTWNREKAPELIQSQLDIIGNVGDNSDQERIMHDPLQGQNNFMKIFYRKLQGRIPKIKSY